MAGEFWIALLMIANLCGQENYFKACHFKPTPSEFVVYKRGGYQRLVIEKDGAFALECREKGRDGWEPWEECNAG